MLVSELFFSKAFCTELLGGGRELYRNNRPWVDVLTGALCPAQAGIGFRGEIKALGT
jgi:hypothetical protein